MSAAASEFSSNPELNRRIQTDAFVRIVTDICRSHYDDVFRDMKGTSNDETHVEKGEQLPSRKNCCWIEAGMLTVMSDPFTLTLLRKLAVDPNLALISSTNIGDPLWRGSWMFAVIVSRTRMAIQAAELVAIGRLTHSETRARWDKTMTDYYKQLRTMYTNNVASMGQDFALPNGFADGPAFIRAMKHDIKMFLHQSATLRGSHPTLHSLYIDKGNRWVQRRTTRCPWPGCGDIKVNYGYPLNWNEPTLWSSAASVQQMDRECGLEAVPGLGQHERTDTDVGLKDRLLTAVFGDEKQEETWTICYKCRDQIKETGQFRQIPYREEERKKREQALDQASRRQKLVSNESLQFPWVMELQINRVAQDDPRPSHRMFTDEERAKRAQFKLSYNPDELTLRTKSGVEATYKLLSRVHRIHMSHYTTDIRTSMGGNEWYNLDFQKRTPRDLDDMKSDTDCHFMTWARTN
jgi:hypothetical protein